MATMPWTSIGAWPVRSMDHILNLGNLARVTQEMADLYHLAYLVMQTFLIKVGAIHGNCR